MAEMFQYSRYIVDENAMCLFGRQLMRAVCRIPAQKAVVLYLNGDLGAGKTTLSRGMIQELGHTGRVKSPTYTLVEEYPFAGKTVYHFDLYRLSDPEELEFMGIRDYFKANAVCLIEWAEKGRGLLVAPDLTVNIDYAGTARRITLSAENGQGSKIIEQLKSQAAEIA